MPLLPYQTKWNKDKARIKAWEKSRRIGASFGDAAKSALLASTQADAGGMSTYYIGTNKDMTSQYVGDTGMWAKKYNLVADEMEEETVILENDQAVTVYRIRFSTGHEVVGLPSKALALRSKQGRVILDEAAFMEDFEAVFAAAKALTMLGGSIGVLSTHNGEDSLFNQLILDIRSGKLPYSLHRITLDDAMADGYYRHVVCKKRRIEYTPEGEQQWYDETLADFGEDADEELFCIPKRGGGAWLNRNIIEACMKPEIPVIEWSPPAEDFVDWDLGVAERETLDWCREHLEPVLKELNPSLRHGMGTDFGRSGDLTVNWPVVELPDLSVHTPFVLELRNAPFRTQSQIYNYIADRLPRLSGLALDARGNGQATAEFARQDYGPEVVAEVMLSQGWYREHSPRLKANLEDRTFTIPKKTTILDDLRAMKIKKGIAMPPEGKSQSGANQRHCDAAVAAILALFAIKTIEGDAGPLEVTTAFPMQSQQLLRGYT
jgi:phage FluMu gp28-like protein